jgi:hypothetical protein
MGGFGVSIGDIIALCILAKDLVISLKDSTGSSNQYLNTIAGLRDPRARTPTRPEVSQPVDR